MLMQSFWYFLEDPGVILANIGRVLAGAYWSQGPQILVVGIPVLAGAREEFVIKMARKRERRKARCDVTTT